MIEVIEKLEVWKKEIELALTKGKDIKLINLKNEISNSVSCLKMFIENNIKVSKISNVINLPSSNTGYSEYRIMNDCETDQINNWIELKINDKPIRCNEGDILILMK
jgi:hypothetical protein